MATTTYTAWGGFASATTMNTYTPGQNDVTNLGLLYNRLVLTADASGTEKIGTGQSATDYGVKIGVDAEKTLLNSPTYEGMVDLYGVTGVKYLELPTKSKSFPGFDDSPTWTEMTDSPAEKVGRTYSGKPERITTYEFGLPANLEIKKILEKHYVAGSLWTLIQCYDDAKESDLFYIVSQRCRILGVGGSNGENNSAGALSVKFQAEGGLFVPFYITQARTVTSS